MTAVKYEIVEHDGGWAYKVGNTFSETFYSHRDALAAAKIAAAERTSLILPSRKGGGLSAELAGLVYRIQS